MQAGEVGEGAPQTGEALCSMGQGQQARRMSVSTDKVRPQDRQALWADWVCDRLVQADCAVEPANGTFAGHVDQWVLATADPATPPTSVSRIRSSAQRVRRTRRHLAAAGQEQVLVNIQRRGVGRVSQDGREAVLQPGDMAIYTSDRPYELAFDSTFEQTVLILPADAVRPWIPSLQRHTAQCVPAASAMAGLLRQAAQQVIQGVTPAAQPALAQSFVHLLHASLAELAGQQPSAQLGRVSRPVGVDCSRSLSASHDAPSQREAEVLNLLARGLNYEEIARHLGRSINTVRTHARGLYAKLGAHNKTEAVFEARQMGWVD